MACNSVNLFNALTGNDPGGVFYDVDGLFGAPGSVVSTPTALDFTGVADGTYAFEYEICIDCDLDGNTNDPGECDTVSFNVEVYNLPDIADIGLCIDDPQWYTVIGDPGANPTHITLIDGDPADYTVGGNPSGLPSSFTAAGLGAGYNSTITITLTPNSGAPVQCACMTVFNVEVEGLPSTAVDDEDILCISCIGPTYDLTSVNGYVDETWYKTNTTGGGTCDGTTVNNGTFTGSLVANPAAEPINEGINTFWAVKQISGGPCGDRYVCQEVEIYGVPTAPANIPDALVIAEPNQDICACVGDYDIDVGPGLDCWEDFYQILLNAGANVVLSGYGETATLPNGVYASYTWDVCDSLGASILNATNNTSDMDYNTLQINCDDFIGIPDGDLTVKITVTTGFPGTGCLNDTYELTIPHTSCCEDCDYEIEVRSGTSLGGAHLSYSDYSATPAGPGLPYYGLQWEGTIWVIQNCENSGITNHNEGFKQVARTNYIIGFSFDDIDTHGSFYLIDDAANQETITVASTGATDNSSLVTWLNNNRPTGGSATWFTGSSNTVRMRVDDTNDQGWDVAVMESNGISLIVGGSGASMVGESSSIPPCGDVDISYDYDGPGFSIFSGFSIGGPGSGSDIELTFEEITPINDLTITFIETGATDRTCEECG